jgi:hypothetical protein
MMRVVLQIYKEEGNGEHADAGDMGETPVE